MVYLPAGVPFDVPATVPPPPHADHIKMRSIMAKSARRIRFRRIRTAVMASSAIANQGVQRIPPFGSLRSGLIIGGAATRFTVVTLTVAVSGDVPPRVTDVGFTVQVAFDGAPEQL